MTGIAAADGSIRVKGDFNPPGSPYAVAADGTLMVNGADGPSYRGSYNVTETQTSLDILAEKMKYARATNAPVIVTANPGCLLQMRAGAKIHSTGQEVVHVIELLDRALKPI